MKVLLSIGCNAYEHLQPLSGAEKDANELFNLLVQPHGDYDEKSSTLLLSPTQELLREALRRALPTGKRVDIFTFFFAGHAGVKASSFYLCVRDSDPDRLSMTAFPIISLFSIINEFQPRQLNIVIDACQAGGSSLDVSQLLKPEVVGHSDATSVTFLGACTSNQLASETSEGGILTRQLLKCLTGERRLQTRSPSLDLIEISADVCSEVHKTHAAQKPIAWGLSLFGSGYFSRNPYYDPNTEPSFAINEILPESEIGKRIRSNSAAIWNEYRSEKELPDPRRLLSLLETIFRNLDGNLSSKIICVRGLAKTFASASQESSDLMAPSQSLATGAVYFLPQIGSDEVESYVVESLGQVSVLDNSVWDNLSVALKEERPPLLSEVGVLADLFYLPLRITRILGWLGLSTIGQTFFPNHIIGDDLLRFSLASALINLYHCHPV